ncbi:diphosphomevalonate decarboxylase [Lactobacillus sp. DCY120]|uniref:diphosphomevalonate decarboxylase n=1 Tax=Bombilactobacillus apium TaxID=2675299 RepID=A0A850QVK6_9LACO|nr:diphosphomevalonate decarboxylase [Bombilactobacillus apium]NVY95824.1 diphosphomevalonate decarboxylase [Bombilactobacillus apium]
MTTTTTAHTNIALIKYWGKKDPQLHLPYTDSLSLTLDGYSTTTTTQFLPGRQDQVQVNGHPASPAFFQRVVNFLDLVRQVNHSQKGILVQTTNQVPTAAGLASSASGFAALAGSLNRLFQMNLTPTQLSCLARRGSGSASRSIFGGFVRWQHGTGDFDSYALPIDEHPQLPLTLLSVVFNGQAKKVSSTQGMEQAVQTSPFYPQWPQIVERDLDEMLLAIQKQDIAEIGQLAESNCLAMHALNWTARPFFTYFTAETWQLINLLPIWRQRGVLVYATVDAGPNVKLITNQETLPVVRKLVQSKFPQAQLTTLYPGPGLT